MNMQAQQTHDKHNSNNNTAALTCWQGPEVPGQHAWHEELQSCVPAGQRIAPLIICLTKHELSPALSCMHAPEVPAWQAGQPTASSAGGALSLPQECVPAGQAPCAVSAKHDVSPFATLSCAHARKNGPRNTRRCAAAYMLAGSRGAGPACLAPRAAVVRAGGAAHGAADHLLVEARVVAGAVMHARARGAGVTDGAADAREGEGGEREQDGEAEHHWCC